MKLRARFSFVTPRYSKTFFPVSSLVYFLSFGPRPRKDDRAVIIQKGRFPHQTGEQTQQCFIRVHLFDVRAPCACVVKTQNLLLRRCRVPKESVWSLQKQSERFMFVVGPYRHFMDKAVQSRNMCF